MRHYSSIARLSRSIQRPIGRLSIQSVRPAVSELAPFGLLLSPGLSATGLVPVSYTHLEQTLNIHNRQTANLIDITIGIDTNNTHKAQVARYFRAITDMAINIISAAPFYL